ncbi:MAG: DCC1-like thiol-disulfide oxidoreductase family protein [Flavobacteriales bacterium]|nr:DCC1-like thiol-disulfide oxidoreductase family protein [Flavobacteriales bacterium]
MKRIHSILEGFLSIDLRTLAFVRVMTGMVIIIDLLSRSADLSAHYSDAGVIPRSFLLNASNEWTFSVFALGGSYIFVSAMFIFTGIVALLLALGWRTRLMTLVAWIMVMSLQNRNPLICYGGDSILRMMLFWGMFVPWGAKYSVDSLRYGFNRLSDHLPNKVFTVGTAGLALQVLYIYIFTALFKNGPEWHSEGTAVYYALTIDELSSRFNHIGRMIPLDVLKGLTWSVLAWEWVGPLVLAWPNWRVRLFGIFGFIFLQMGFNVFLVLGLFPVFATLAILVFIPSEVWDRLGARFITDRQRNLRIYYDPECGFCQHMVIALNRFLLFDSAKLLPASDDQQASDNVRIENSWTVQDAQGRSFVKGAALVQVIAHSPLFWPLAKLLRVLTPALNTAYRLVATDRPTWPSFRPFPNGIISTYSVTMSIPSIILATWCLMYVTLFNMHRYDVEKLPIPKSLYWVSGLFKVDQNWAMFAPAPYRADGWYVIPAVLANGDTVDIFRNGAPVNWERPERAAADFRNTRWSKYLRTIRKGKYAGARKHYINWLRKEWDDNHPPEQHLKRFTMYFMLENNLYDWQTEPPKKVHLWTKECANSSGSESQKEKQ